jgi:hypothetical protein
MFYTVIDTLLNDISGMCELSVMTPVTASFQNKGVYAAKSTVIMTLIVTIWCFGI